MALEDIDLTTPLPDE